MHLIAHKTNSQSGDLVSSLMREFQINNNQTSILVIRSSRIRRVHNFSLFVNYNLAQGQVDQALFSSTVGSRVVQVLVQ